MEPYRKLVRDRIPEILTGKGVPFTVTTVTGDAYRLALIEKLQEELQEFLEAYAVEELADLIEVIEALKALPAYQAVEAIRSEKRSERGGFENGLVVTGEK